MTNLEKEPMDTGSTEDRTNEGGQTVFLTPSEVAHLLGVSENTAIRIMTELPHLNVSRNIDSKRRRVRITRQILEDFLNGKIERKPNEEEEDLNNDNE